MTLVHHFAAMVKLERELGRWRRLGVRPRLWWRDDDARTPSAALDRLLTVADGRPLALAVIPDGELHALSARLANACNVVTGQHGIDHVNRRPDGEKPSEYALPPTSNELFARVAWGRDQLAQAGLTPQFYTPPWNAIDPGLGRAVSRVGISILSAGGPVERYADLVYMSADADLTAWKGGARFKGAMRVFASLQRALRERRRAGELQRPVGLLTHHLAHDEATWRFLAWSLPHFDRAFDWVNVAGVLHPAIRRPEEHTASARVEPMAQPRPV